LNTINFKDKKLNGAINGIGISFAIFGSTPPVIKLFRISVLIDQKTIKFNKNFIPDLE
jgi:hypothetical protein